jgi:hypothetical protein
MHRICEQPNPENLKENITFDHLYLSNGVLSPKIGSVKQTRHGHNFRSKKKSPHGGRQIGHPLASMRGFFFCSKIVAVARLFNTAKG